MWLQAYVLSTGVVRLRTLTGSWAAIFLTPTLLQLLTTAVYCVCATDESYRTYYARRQGESSKVGDCERLLGDDK